MARSDDLGEELRRFGLGFPGAREDHPWGETVLKVRDKVFVFLGRPGGELRFSVKLPRSGERLLDQDYAEPTGYGLGKSGWVTVTARPGTPARAELEAWIEESYRAVAPKKLVAELEGAAPAPLTRKKAPRAAPATRRKA